MSHTAILTVSQSWLNNSFLEKVLKSSEDDENLQVTSYQITRATAAGDNYASALYRVSVQYTTRGQPETTSLIVKTESTKQDISKLINEANIFQRESTILSEITPHLHNVLQEANVDSYKIQPFAPKCLYSQFGPPGTAIVLEDLKAQGFKMAERTMGLDMNHCSLVLRTLARYHATSAILYEQNPEFFNSVQENLYNGKMKNNIEGFFGNSFRNLVKEIKNWPEFDDRFRIKLEKMSEIVVDHVIEINQKQDGDFNVLTHGDLWLNNMMFRYSESTGEVQDIRFVDFQFCTLTSAALDLQYFLHTSPSPGLIDKHSVLVEEYHKTLGDTLTLLGHKHLHPTLEKFKKDFDKKGMFAVIIACCLLPVVLVDHSEIPDMDKIFKNEQKLKFSKLFKETLHKLLPIFEEKGWLELDKYIEI